MKWLFDTNVVSENIRPRPDGRVLEWIAKLDPHEVTISVVTLAELLDGAARTTSEPTRRRLADWIDHEIKPAFSGRILPLSIEVLVECLALGRRHGMRGRPQSAQDTLIAATARVHDLVIVSRNSKDFAGTGVTVFDPWTGKNHRMAEP